MISSLLLLIAIIAGTLTGPGCANIIPPAGGPRDSLPPIIIKASPNDSTRNFKGNRIVLSFNEFVEVQSPQENIVISPLPKTFPTVEYKLNTVTVKLKDSLEPNTTYHIQFGNAIKDFNEGNVLKDPGYTFSTGNYIDSLELSGKVILAETGKIDTTLIVMLHTDSRDSAVVKDKPRYISKLDNNGRFFFKNLPPKTFYIYALKDEAGTRRYFRDNQLFAFSSKPIVVTGKNEPVTLYAYASKPPTLANALTAIGNKNKINNVADKRLRYTTTLSAGIQDLLVPFKFTFDIPLKTFDSSRLQLFTDSNFVPVAKYNWLPDSTRKIITLQTVWKENTTYAIIMDKDFAADTLGRKLLKSDTIVFHTKKLTEYGSLKIRFKNLDLSKNPVLFLVVGENIYKSIPFSGNEISLDLFPPGEYELRILFDENKNGRWDPGEFFGKHKQPEIVKTLTRKVNVKAGFANEFDIDAE